MAVDSMAVGFMAVGSAAVSAAACLLVQGSVTDILMDTTVIPTDITTSTFSVTVKQRMPGLRRWSKDGF